MLRKYGPRDAIHFKIRSENKMKGWLKKMKKKLVSILLLASSLAAFSCGTQNGDVVTTDPGTNSDSTNVESTPPRNFTNRKGR